MREEEASIFPADRTHWKNVTSQKPFSRFRRRWLICKCTVYVQRSPTLTHNTCFPFHLLMGFRMDHSCLHVIYSPWTKRDHRLNPLRKWSLTFNWRSALTLPPSAFCWPIVQECKQSDAGHWMKRMRQQCSPLLSFTEQHGFLGLIQIQKKMQYQYISSVYLMTSTCNISPFNQQLVY